MAEKKRISNFSVVFKHTIKNVYTRVTTYVAYAVLIIITLLTQVIVPLIIDKAFSNITNNGSAALAPLLQNIIYVSSLILGITTCLVSSVVLQLNETTFELSRPLSRRNFIGAKMTVASISNTIMFIWVIACSLIMQAIIANRTISSNYPHGISIFSDPDLNIGYATLLLPPIFVCCFSTFATFILRPFIIKRDGLISMIIVFLTILTYQIYPIVKIATDPTAKQNLQISLLLLPTLVFGIGSFATFIGTFLVYDKLYVKV